MLIADFSDKTKCIFTYQSTKMCFSCHDKVSYIPYITRLMVYNFGILNVCFDGLKFVFSLLSSVVVSSFYFLAVMVNYFKYTRLKIFSILGFFLI